MNKVLLLEVRKGFRNVVTEVFSTQEALGAYLVSYCRREQKLRRLPDLPEDDKVAVTDYFDLWSGDETCHVFTKVLDPESE